MSFTIFGGSSLCRTLLGISRCRFLRFQVQALINEQNTSLYNISFVLNKRSIIRFRMQNIRIVLFHLTKVTTAFFIAIRRFISRITSILHMFPIQLFSVFSHVLSCWLFSAERCCSQIMKFNIYVVGLNRRCHTMDLLSCKFEKVLFVFNSIVFVITGEKDPFFYNHLTFNDMVQSIRSDVQLNFDGKCHLVDFFTQRWISASLNEHLLQSNVYYKVASIDWLFLKKMLIDFMK